MPSFLTNKQVAVEIAAGVGGRAPRKILDIDSDVAYGVGAVNQSLGEITREFRKSARSNDWVPMPVRRGKPEPIETELTAKMQAVNYLERFGADDRFNLFVRYTGGGDPTLPLSYRRIDLLVDVAIAGFNRENVATDGTDDETDVILTIPVNAGQVYRLNPIAGKSVVHGLTGAGDCNITCITVASDGTIYAGTEADSTGTHPFVLVSPDGGDTWTSYELSTPTADISAIMIAGNKLFVATGTAILYTEAVVNLTGAVWTSTTAAQNVNALYAIDAANLVAVGAAGMMLMSEDGGGSWSPVTTGSAATLGCVAFRDINEGYIGGATGTLLKYDQGTISVIADPTSGATITTIALPDDPSGGRDQDVYIGTATGKVFKSFDGGTSWEQMRFPGDNAGTVDALVFYGFKGAVLFILHTPVAGSTRVLRDLSGGYGGNTEVEAVSTPANSGLNALLVANQNLALAVGDVHSGASMIISVEA